jgi:hypothetical protein
MSPDLYYVHSRTQDSLGNPVHALSAHPCGPSTPTHGQLVHSDDSDAGRGSCGVLLWADDGVLKLVGVQARWRRNGIGAALWKQARDLSGLSLDQAPTRTALGEAWFQALGIDAPLEVLNSPMTSRDEAINAAPNQLFLDDEEAVALRIAALLNKAPNVLPYIRALCAPTYEEAAEQMRKL